MYRGLGAEIPGLSSKHQPGNKFRSRQVFTCMTIVRALAREDLPEAQPDRQRYRLTGQGRAPSLDEQSRVRKFEQLFVAHLDAAYDLARWLTRDERNAEDVVQEAYLRAFKFLDGFHGDNARVWLLAIVRNTYYTWLRKNQFQALSVPFEEETAAVDAISLEIDGGNPVHELLQQKDARRLINSALEQLPEEFREVIVLR